jgi:hypothetical protein
MSGVFRKAARRIGAEPAGCVRRRNAALGPASRGYGGDAPPAPGPAAGRYGGDAPPAPGPAADTAGMRRIAVPYVAAQADDPRFAMAGLLYRGGQGEFTTQAAFEWPCARSGSSVLTSTAPKPHKPRMLRKPRKLRKPPKLRCGGCCGCGGIYDRRRGLPRRAPFRPPVPPRGLLPVDLPTAGFRPALPESGRLDFG